LVLVITSGLRDTSGAPVISDDAFTACLTARATDYCSDLASAVSALQGRFGSETIVGASIFTTLSATAWLESARVALASVPPAFQRTGAKNLFTPAELTGGLFRKQVGVNPSAFSDDPLLLSLIVGARAIAFGSFRSPDFLRQQVIPQTPTGMPVDAPATTTQIFFHVVLPDAPKPAGGYPVVIFGHGITDNRFMGPTGIASTLAGAGFAMIAFNAVGHGFGPESKLVLQGASIELPAPGRGVDLNGDGKIEDEEGCVVSTPVPSGLRDCLRQTALDQMQLVRAIQAGVDLDGDGSVDLDASRISYVGQSLGALYGTLLNAVEPAISAAALNSGGGTVMDIARRSPAFRPLVTLAAAARQPPLLNKGTDFDDNYVLRYLPAKVNTVPGAIEIQNFIERLEWLQSSGDPVNFAPHLNSSTLPGVPIKNVLWQFPRGDMTVPNPAQTALVRAANMRESTWLYRHDIAIKILPVLDPNPHIYLLNLLAPAAVPVALSAQSQIADFLASGGLVISDPNGFLIRLVFGRSVFEVPDFLPEDLGF
jgi:hypothetical protein